MPDFPTIADGYGADGCHWHGTHVAGIVGGSMTGVAKQATLHSIRVLDCNGNGSTSDVIAGINWMLANKSLPAVANMSLSGALSQALNDAVASAVDALRSRTGRSSQLRKISENDGFLRVRQSPRPELTHTTLL